MSRIEFALKVATLLGALLLVLCVCSWATSSANNSQIGAGEVRSILVDLEEKMQGVHNVQTNFTQTKRVPMLKHEIVLKGSAFMQKPDRFAWHTKSPIRNSIVLRDGAIHQWNEDTDEVEILSLGDAPALKGMIDHTQTWFYGAYVAMLEDYDVRLLARNPLTLEFRPRSDSGAAALIARVRVQFQPDQSYLSSIQLVEKDGTRSLIEFGGTVLNGKLDGSVWEVRRNPG